MNGLLQSEFLEAFPSFSNAPERQVKDLLSRSTLSLFPDGKLVYSEGDACLAIAFLLSGDIRVYKAVLGVIDNAARKTIQ